MGREVWRWRLREGGFKTTTGLHILSAQLHELREKQPAPQHISVLLGEMDHVSDYWCDLCKNQERAIGLTSSSVPLRVLALVAASCALSTERTAHCDSHYMAGGRSEAGLTPGEAA
ncbi:hypothetical protein JZ751_023750 [Albula glossodonta]|uniref:Uncharacterized protein n=1 Tax=Albula glossodonta TaxID=121402 RepID=A0A8T2NP65_9TELE|nr:hypothetical protein JZ751_023750 [Albula glossodonta]